MTSITPKSVLIRDKSKVKRKKSTTFLLPKSANINEDLEYSCSNKTPDILDFNSKSKECVNRSKSFSLTNETKETSSNDLSKSKPRTYSSIGEYLLQNNASMTRREKKVVFNYFCINDHIENKTKDTVVELNLNKYSTALKPNLIKSNMFNSSINQTKNLYFPILNKQSLNCKYQNSKDEGAFFTQTFFHLKI